MEGVVYKSVSLDQALLPDRDNPLLPTQSIQNRSLGFGLTIIQQATDAIPVILADGGLIDITAPKDGSFLLSQGTLLASPSLTFALPYVPDGGGQNLRAFYNKQLGYIRFINSSGVQATITYQLFRVDGKVGSS